MQTFRDTTSDYTNDTPIKPGDINLDDFNNIDLNAKKLATWLRTKMYGRDVRESLALWTEFAGKVSDYLLKSYNSLEYQLDTRQTDVEKRQTELEEQFKQVISNATVDSEVILARDDTVNKQQFSTLEDRLNWMTTQLSSYVPTGFKVTIKHNLGRFPSNHEALYYEWAMGSEPNGLGATPDGTLGARNIEPINVSIQNTDANTTVINMPLKYQFSDVTPTKECDGNWYLADSYKTIRIKLN